MKFDETHKVDWWLLSKDEARAFIRFLWIERWRHRLDIFFARIMEFVQVYCSLDINTKATCDLWWSQIRRHREDIDEIEILVRQVKHWYKL